MKVAVIGSHGTGKSTIVNIVSKTLGWNIIPDVAAEAFHKKFLINENTPPETQFWILSKQLEYERNTPDSWIMEKSLWDNIIYGAFSIKCKATINEIRKIVEANASYDLVFYCPIEFSIPDDGIRSLNVEFQKAIDDSLNKYLKRKKIKFHTLKGNIDERVKKALDIIEEKEKSE